jgi:hypothetical protein
MKLGEVQEILGADSAWQARRSDCAEREVSSCHASDLISDMLSFRGSGSMLLTGLTNAQVVRTAEILDFVAICFVRSKKPEPEAVALAEKKDIPLLVSPLSMYESCGRLHARDLPAGVSKKVIADWQPGK